jgi:predicted HAD superfamily Cof-like phosphohydrolase
MNEAVKNNDLVELVDAWSDILYVVYGAASCFGVDLDAFIDPEKTQVVEEENVDQNIFENHEKITLDINNWVKYINEASEEKNLNKYVEGLTQLVYCIYKTSFDFGINIDKAFDIVHESNMTKACTDEQRAIDTVKDYKNNDPRYDSPNYKKSSNGKYWVIWNESSNKVLKSLDYTPANLKYLLKQED